MRASRVGQKQNSRHFSAAFVGRVVGFYVKDAPLGNRFFAVYVVPDLMRAIIQVHAEIELHNAMLRDFFCG